MSGKIYLWDLECSNLNANFGYILAGGYKNLGDSKTKALHVGQYPKYANDPTDDKRLVKDLSDILSDADCWVTWYGLRFDVPYLNSRLIYHGYSPMPPVPHIDLWRVSRYQLRLNSNRLASASSFLGLEEKTRLDGPTWIRASAGHKPSLKYVVEHCIQDVEVLEQAYGKMRPLILNGPNVGIILSGDNYKCPNCGGVRVRRGFRVTANGKKQRYQCNQCGGWSLSGGNAPEFNQSNKAAKKVMSSPKVKRG